MARKAEDYPEQVRNGKTSRRLVMIATLVGISMALILLAGCATTPTAGAPTPVPAVPTATSAPEPTAPEPTAEAEGGVLTIVGGIDIDSMDPHIHTMSEGAAFRSHIYDGLFEFDQDNVPQPHLAKSYEMSADGLTYTFYLQEGVEFHDGTPFNAEAVKANFDRVTEPDRETPSARNMAMIESTEVVDDYTVKVTLNKPFQPFIIHLATSAGHIASPTSFEAWNDDPRAEGFGTGPFKFGEWKIDEQFILERNPDYWKGMPKLERIIWRVVPEDSARVTMLKTGEGDVVLRIPPHEAEALSSEPNIDLVKVDTFRSIYYALNMAHPPFDNKMVRQAFNYAIDREAIIESVLFGAGTPSDSILANTVWGYHGVDMYDYDPEKARQMLEEAGFDFDQTIRMWGPEGRYVRDKQVDQAIQAQLADIGVTVDIQTFGEWATYMSETGKRDEFEMAMMGWAPSTGDADVGMRLLVHGDHSDACCNFSGYSNPEVDSLLDEAGSEIDTEKRRELYAQAQEIIMEDAPFLFSHSQAVFMGVNERVHDIHQLPSEWFMLMYGSVDE